MRIGLYVSPAGVGSMDEVLARFARAEALGFHATVIGRRFGIDDPRLAEALDVLQSFPAIRT